MAAFLAHATAFQLAALATAACILGLLGALRWRGLTWSRRLAYVAGAVVLGYYELHMTWLWLLLGAALILWPLVSAAKSPGPAAPKEPSQPGSG